MYYRVFCCFCQTSDEVSSLDPLETDDADSFRDCKNMSHKYERLLNAILQEPISGNIHWREVESLLHHLGAVMEPGHGARVRVLLNGVEGTLRRPHHSGVCSKHDIRHLREYLAAARVSLASYEADN